MTLWIAAVYVATYLDVQASRTNQGIELMRQYNDKTRVEAGNFGVEVLQEIGRPNHFVIVEFWTDQPAFDAHEKADHTLQFRSRLKAIHNSPYDQRVHQALAVDSRPHPAASGTVREVTHVDVPPPRREQTELLLKRLVDDSKKDGGSLHYDVFQETTRSNHFTIFGTWKDRAAFEAHETQAHTRQFRESVAPLLGAPYDERLYVPIAK
jgi:quinol monooxygenase YgiN